MLWKVSRYVSRSTAIDIAWRTRSSVIGDGLPSMGSQPKARMLPTTPAVPKSPR